MSIYEKIILKNKRKFFAVLIDPDKYDKQGIDLVMSSARESQVDFILVGGSLLAYDHLEETLQR